MLTEADKKSNASGMDYSLLQKTLEGEDYWKWTDLYAVRKDI